MKAVSKVINGYYYYYELGNTNQPVIEVLNVTGDAYRSGTIGINEIILSYRGNVK
ncbi:MAG: hypothetical protein LUD02_08310 [Tannerellaceae bacterium]|nr:hypothetical protein [Tannerellaceae bacterium]